MSRNVAVPISILCVFSQLISKCSAQWVDTSGNRAFNALGLGTNSFGFGIGAGAVYGGRPGQQLNYGNGIPLNCIGTMGPGVPGIGYGNGASMGPGYLGPPIGQQFGYGNGIESNCISNCLMGAGLDYGNGLGVVPGYSNGMGMMNPNPGYLNAMPNLVGPLDPSIGGLANGLPINPTVPSIPQQTALNANENTNTNTNVNINNNMDKHRNGRFGMFGMPHL